MAYKKALITFGDEKYEKSISLLEKTARENGVESFTAYGPDSYTDEFHRKNRHILNQPRGKGYWLWKPWIILQEFDKLSEGDVVMYSDAGLYAINDVSPLYETCDERMVFKIPDTHYIREWTKKDCFVLTECDTPEYQNARMVNGAVSLWRVSNGNRLFLEEWLRICKDSRAITDMPNMFGPNYFGFKAHRHDQSILSLLAKKRGFEVYRDPTQYGQAERTQFENSPYGQIFWHHRNFKHPQPK